MIDRRLVQMRLTKHLGLALAPDTPGSSTESRSGFLWKQPHESYTHDIVLRIEIENAYAP